MIARSLTEILPQVAGIGLDPEDDDEIRLQKSLMVTGSLMFIADYYEEASILFADVVDFTPMTAAMTPVEVVEMLNAVFSDFDDLVKRLGLEKIKTIGDCYMVAAGVPQPRDDHAHILAEMALAIREMVSQKRYGGRQLAFRIGINSGPVVAGVIGRGKFSYDMWGDTVNTASRMESHGLAGEIQVTEATYRLLAGRYDLKERGMVEVKGKGAMRLYLLHGRSVAEADGLDPASG